MQKRGIPAISSAIESIRIQREFDRIASELFAKGSMPVINKTVYPHIRMFTEEGVDRVSISNEFGDRLEFTFADWERMGDQLREYHELAKSESNPKDHEQSSALLDLEGLKDQIGKHHWLNVHFRAFRLANEAWGNHARACAKHSHTGEAYDRQHEEAKIGPQFRIMDCGVVVTKYQSDERTDADGLVTLTRQLTIDDRSVSFSVAGVQFSKVPEVLELMKQAEKLQAQ